MAKIPPAAHIYDPIMLIVISCRFGNRLRLSKAVLPVDKEIHSNTLRSKTLKNIRIKAPRSPYTWTWALHSTTH